VGAKPPFLEKLMKYPHSLAFVLAVALLSAGVSFAATISPRSLGYDSGAAGVTGRNANPHNLSNRNTGTTLHATNGEDRICVFCHTPHGSSPQTPLWNRPNLADPDSSYPLYAGAVDIKNIAAAKYTTDGSVQYPNGASRMCLSCHDGVTAVGQVLNGADLASLTMPPSGIVDLSVSHPISFVYNATVLAGLNPVNYQLPVTDTKVPRDSQSRMQCTTCHDPHLDTKDDFPGYSLPFWRNYTGTTNEAADYDATCNECHIGGAYDPAAPPMHNF
jgi:cytochrome c553